MRTLWLTCGVVALSVGAAMASDFPQWRGPGRTGVASDSPTLAERWGEDGPPVVWQAGDFPGGGEGGYGSVAVASGRAYVFVNQKYKVPIPTRTLTEQALRGLGWFDANVPIELVRAVEAARVSEERQNVDRDKRREWIDNWVQSRLRSDEQRKAYGRFLSDRLNRGEKALPLAVLDRLATIRDKGLADANALEKWLADNGIEGDAKEAVLRAIPTEEGRSWDTVYCYGAANGKPLWKARYDGAPGGRGASCTPCVADGRCYAVGSIGTVYCLNAADGREVWKTQVEGAGAVHSSPLVAEGAIVLLVGRLTAFDAETGKRLWQAEKLTGRESSPVAWRHAGRTYILCNTGRDVACVDLRTGEVRWTVPGGGGPRRPSRARSWPSSPERRRRACWPTAFPRRAASCSGRCLNVPTAAPAP